jgi:hypothetical protein
MERGMATTLRERAPKHLQALQISSLLTARWYRMQRPEATMYEPEAVIRLLNRAKVKFILVGTHGIAGWRSSSRATQDTDVLVALKDYEKAVRTIHTAFPELEVAEWKKVTRFKDLTTGEVVIDILNPTDDLFKATFRYSIAAGKSHRVPDLEMALALKYAAMISPYRSYDKKLIDGGDFVNIVMHRYADVNIPKLKRLAEKVFHGGGADIAKMLADIRAERPIKF